MNKTQLLVVEDEGIVAKDLQALLRRLGYHVPTTVGTGELAIQIAAQNRPDLILMDIQLRGAMDGVQAATAINAVQDVPIVYLTANSDEATLRRARETAPFGFLVKPFEERAIQAGIEMALYKHRTDRQIREREQWLDTTLRSIADAVVTTDASGRITFLNAAAEALSGWNHVEALGRPYQDIFKIVEEASRHPAEDRVAGALREGFSSSLCNHTLLTRRDGAERHIEHSVAPIRQGPEERIGGCVIVFSDVSDRKNLEDRVRHMQKMDAIGKLAGGIAHDFNKAITAIIGYAEMILGQVQAPDPLHKEASQIVKAAEHSARLTHQLLAFSRKQILQPRSLDLAGELAHVQGMVRRLIGERIELCTEVAPGLWPALADPGQIEQVVLNLSINARDAMPNGGVLTLSLANSTLTAAEALHIPEGRPGEFVVLKVRDTGTGMSREVVTRIFEPFFTTKQAGKGTGLGLSTCHGIVRQTGGMISVSSTLGVGTSFAVYLPKAECVEAAAIRPVEETNIPRGHETILFVEDEEILRELGLEVLQSLGYRVIAAEDGRAAVALLESSGGVGIDLVVTDLMMPRMSGRELLAWISQHVGELRVLFMSGYTDDEIVRDAVHGSSVEYLQKPFTPNVLARKVREVLDQRRVVSSAAA